MAGPLLYDRVKETTTTTGTGTLTLAGAVSGFRAFSTVGNANTCPYCIEHTTANEWEVGIGTYTLSGTTLARTLILASSNAGAAVNFAAGTKNVFLCNPAIWSGAQVCRPGGRLTLTTAVPITTADVTAAGTIYYTPYLDNRLELWNGSGWVPTVFAEVSLALSSLTSAKNYDVFGYLTAGVLTLEFLVWTNDTTRATAITLQDGRYCKSGDKTRLYLGTFRTTGTTTTEDSRAKRFLWNLYNAVPRQLQKNVTDDNWTCSATSFRQWNANAANQAEYLVGLAGVFVQCNINGLIDGSVAVWFAIGLDSTTVASGQYVASFGISGGQSMTVCNSLWSALGYHYLALLEKVASGSINNFGDNGAGTALQCGIDGWLAA